MRYERGFFTQMDYLRFRARKKPNDVLRRCPPLRAPAFIMLRAERMRTSLSAMATTIFRFYAPRATLAARRKIALDQVHRDGIGMRTIFPLAAHARPPWRAGRRDRCACRPRVTRWAEPALVDDVVWALRCCYDALRDALGRASRLAAAADAAMGGSTPPEGARRPAGEEAVALPLAKMRRPRRGRLMRLHGGILLSDDGRHMPRYFCQKTSRPLAMGVG